MLFWALLPPADRERFGLRLSRLVLRAVRSPIRPRGGRVMPTDPKIRADHLRRQAVVYVRQSTPHQVRGNRESTVRQYALADRAKALGWPAAAVQTIDEDQGRSGARSDHRDGFKRLWPRSAPARSGVVLALEASRLARSSVDWHRLVEICGITKTLLADESAVYDPRDPNDRLLLGVKGTLSEAELMTIRCRLHDGRWSKARRGELAKPLPVGYVRTEAGVVVKHPGPPGPGPARLPLRPVRRAAGGPPGGRPVRREKLQIPAQAWGGPGHGEVRWKVPTFGAIMRISAQSSICRRVRLWAEGVRPVRPLPDDRQGQDDVPAAGRLAGVRARTCTPPYITWDAVRAEPADAPGQLVPGRHPRGAAPRAGVAPGDRPLRPVRGPDERVLLLDEGEAGPGVRVRGGVRRRRGDVPDDELGPGRRGRGRAVPGGGDPGPGGRGVARPGRVRGRAGRGPQAAADAVQRAEYEVEIARRRYEAADPANRLVAAELEARWEEALRERERLKREAEELDRQAASPLGAAERRRVREMAADLGKVWHAATTGMEDRKELLRFLVHRVYLDGVTEAGQIRIEVEWHTGARTQGHGAAPGGRGVGPEDAGGRGRTDSRAIAYI